ncbi:peptide ABC transporter permease [Rhodococcus sp. 15-649-2-2]|uniref:ABC transporter permease n=1 Tax=Rhodococcus sp. 15-649-2-2 TaxID=2023140 RepID=UPI000B9C28B0|nr:ABC transporter permease [Rhodococcus sp. 15-649-2-2]OZE80476.1 peptide ABC transporter permease [Rhodococcus sp. 15-649-2-2]
MSDILIRETAVHSAVPPVVEEAPAPARRRGPRDVLKHIWLGASVVVLLLALGFALFPTVFASGDPLVGTPADKLQAPSAAHWFGTDNIGRDVFTRVVHGSGLSLTATLLAVGIALVVGSIIGLVSGAVGGVVDAVLMRIVDVLLSIPTLLLSLALVTALGFGTVNVAIAVGVTLIANFARVMRSEVLRVRRSLYVEAAYASGVRWFDVFRRHILRNSYGPVIALAAVEFGMAVLAVSALSFLGFGAAPPTPEWGSLISEGRNFLATAWWMTTLPGLVIVAVVVSAHRVGHALERRSQ